MFEMILASMAGFWLGLFLLVTFGSLIWASESDSFFMGVGVLIVSWAIAEYIFDISILASIIANPFMLIIYLILFIAVGALYAAMWKLPNFVQKNSDRIQQDYDNWKDIQTRENDLNWRDKARGILPGEREEKAPADVSYEAFLNSDRYKYSVRNNKDRVASWVLLWPAGVIWELAHKPFVWAWNKIYYGLGEIFERINKDAARKILEGRKK